MTRTAILALEDGSIFQGIAIGIDGETCGEIIFNTSMVGYQEILTDPSYSRQIVTLTYPHIGNTGTNIIDQESESVQAAGLIIRDLPLMASSWRCTQSLDEYLKSHNVIALAGIDTRKLTRILRENGSKNGCILAGTAIDKDNAIIKAQAFPGLKGIDLARKVSTTSQYTWKEGVWNIESDSYHAPTKHLWNVVVYDFGIKQNILRMLVQRKCRLTVVPAETPVKDVIALKPDGVFLSNGPGDPEPCIYAIEATKELLAMKLPIFGICLGYQILALASGAKTEKMKFGHHGANHPVQDLNTKKVMITSQNHSFCVSNDLLPDCLRVTHKSLFDGSLQGLERIDTPAFGFQGHPEGSPGPHDAALLFDRFIQLIAHSKADNQDLSPFPLKL